MTESAFFVPDGDGFVGTPHTGGPWDPTRLMHFGPPAALLGRHLQAMPADQEMFVARVTYEILRPVPIGHVTVTTQVVRPGRRIELVEATLRTGDTELALARGWRIRVGEVAIPEVAAPPVGMDDIEGAHDEPFFEIGVDQHYGKAMELRFEQGSFLEPGPAVVWVRQRIPLVLGEEPSPLERVLVVADSGNGVSATADPRALLFVNTDLSVHLVRPLQGEWVGLSARTMMDPGGFGQADTALSDRVSRIGRSVQTLFVDRQP